MVFRLIANSPGRSDLMVCVTGGLDMHVHEFDQVAGVIQSLIPGTTDCVLSSIIEPDITAGQLQVLIIAAGIEPWV